MTTEKSLWQVPEICVWNRYIEDSADAVAKLGWSVLRPKVCEDGSAVGSARTWDGPFPGIVHLHWPEKLAKSMGADQTIELIKHLKRQGARVVQTIHNISPHESAMTTPWFQHTVDTLTDGAHFFSAEHELVARANRPGLPARSLTLPHPQYTSTPPIRVGCFGRIREYKRTADFAEALLADADLEVQLVVIGHVDSEVAAERLQALADADPRLDFQPEFVDAQRFDAAIASVDWVALPYRSLHSSGVLVRALQAGRRVMSPRPVGGIELYGDYRPNRWLVVHPWTDDAAVRAFTQATDIGRKALALPRWASAARELIKFYNELAARPPRAHPEEK